MATYRKCSVCGNKVLEGTQCKCEIARNKESYRQYKKNRTDKKEQSFYNSKDWIRIRNVVRAGQLGMDIYEYMTTGLIVQAECYHHIICLKDCYDKGLDKNNLIGLSKRNHIYIHSLYDKDEDTKKQTQLMLFDLLNKFYKEFGL